MEWGSDYLKKIKATPSCTVEASKLQTELLMLQKKYKCPLLNRFMLAVESYLKEPESNNLYFYETNIPGTVSFSFKLFHELNKNDHKVEQDYGHYKSKLGISF